MRELANITLLTEASGMQVFARVVTKVMRISALETSVTASCQEKFTQLLGRLLLRGVWLESFTLLLSVELVLRFVHHIGLLELVVLLTEGLFHELILLTPELGFSEFVLTLETSSLLKVTRFLKILVLSELLRISSLSLTLIWVPLILSTNIAIIIACTR